MRLLIAAALAVPVIVPAAVRAQPHITLADARDLADSLTTGGRVHKLVEFEYGKRRIYSKTREELAAIAETCREHPNMKLIVEGHAFAYDEEKTIELGEKRADLVRTLLIRYGVDPKNITAVDSSRLGEPGRYVDLVIETR